MADGFVTKLEDVGKDIVKVIEDPFKFVVKAEKVLQTAITDQPELKTVLTTMVQKAEEVGASAVLAGSSKGLNLAEDATALQQAQAFFEYFKASVVPVIEKVFAQVKADVTSPVAPAVPAPPVAAATTA